MLNYRSIFDWWHGLRSGDIAVVNTQPHALVFDSDDLVGYRVHLEELKLMVLQVGREGVSGGEGGGGW